MSVPARTNATPTHRSSRAAVSAPAPSTPVGAAGPIETAPVLRPACACDGGCPRCSRAAGPDGPAPVQQEPRAVQQVLRATGHPLDAATRRFMEGGFGRDFGSVRIHQGPAADYAARSVGAKAFASGSQIVFGAGHYSPQTPKGQWLLAHELAHVAQTQPGVSSRTADVERDARGAATAVLHGRRTRVGARHDGTRLHRFGEPENVPEISYISTQGGQGFLQEALDFHQAWGLTVHQVGSVEEMVNHLAQATTPLNRIRFVTHAAQVGVFSSLFAGEPLESLQEGRVSAYAEGDAQGLAFDTRMSLSVPLAPFVAEIRSTSPALLRPFGLETSGVPTGQLAEFFNRVLHLEALTSTKTAQNAAQFDPLISALPVVIDHVATLVVQEFAAAAQAAATGGTGATAPTGTAPAVTLADVLALRPAIQAAITALSFTFSGIAVPNAQAVKVREAQRAIAGGFRQNLDTARGRFTSDSWVDIRGCNAGNDLAYLRAVQRFFGTPPALPHVSAPNWFQVFPFLRLRSFATDANVNRVASDPDAAAALDQWSPVTGARQQMEMLRTFYEFEILRREHLANPPAGAPSLAPPPVISVSPLVPGWPTTAADRTAVALLRIMVPDLQLQAPSLFQPQPRFSLPGDFRLTDPGIAVARSALDRLTAANAELHYYLDSGLVLPVFVGANRQVFEMWVMTSLRDQAIDDWLASQWSSAAPGLATLQALPSDDQGTRRVQGLVEARAATAGAQMVFPPDPAYWQHINRI